MNHHQRHTPPGAKWALHCSALLLAAVLSSPDALASLHWPSLRAAPAKPATPGYLSTVGAPELRFQERVVPPARPKTKPVAAVAKVEKTADTPDMIVPAETATPAPEQQTVTAAAPSEETPQPPKKAGPSLRILPDNARPTAHPEDFLPYFRFPATPGKPGGAEVIVPVPSSPSSGAPLPTSSATYTQTPK